MPLQNFRVEFAVADAGTDCHFWLDFCRCANDLAAIIHGDAVTAAQRCVGSEHAQNSFDAIETMSCVFDQVPGAGDQSSMEIGKMVAAHHAVPPKAFGVATQR